MIAAAAGAALAAYAAALGNGLAALFWPRAAFGVLVIGAVAGGLAGLAMGAAGRQARERVQRASGVLLGCAVAAGAAALAAVRAVADAHAPGSGALGLPALFIAVCALPFVLAAATAVSSRGAAADLRGGWLLVGAGAAWLASAGLAGTALPLRAPWLGGHVATFAPAGAGAARLVVDRGLRDIAVAPERPAPLPFVPPPDPAGPVEALFVGLPDGQVLASVLAATHVRLTVLEEDPGLVAAALRHWPALEAARAAGRVRFATGSPRRWVARSRERFGLIALADGQTADAHRARALSPRADHRWTVEAFRSYLSRLRPEGYLMAQRAAIGRVVTTLRAASGAPPERFREQVVVFGHAGQPVAQCWYRPAGFADPASQETAMHHGVNARTEIFYRPSKRPMPSVYEALVRGARQQGLYFSTPLDLSPTVDERPFFDHVERLTVSPVGRGLPEEAASVGPPARLTVIPAADRDVWWALLAGAGAGAALLAAGVRRGSRAAPCDRPASALPTALLLGGCAALALEAFHAWARWLAPSPPAATAALGAALAGAGACWLGARRRAVPRAALAALAATLVLFVVGGYRAAPLLGRFDAPGATAGLVAAGALLGGAVALAARAAVLRVADARPGAGPWLAGAALAAAALSWPAGRLVATHFGYRLVWALAAVAAAAATRGLARSFGRRPAAPPT